MISEVARKLYESIQRGDPLDGDWFWEAGALSTESGSSLDIVIWEAVREILAATGVENAVELSASRTE